MSMAIFTSYVILQKGRWKNQPWMHKESTNYWKTMENIWIYGLNMDRWIKSLSCSGKFATLKLGPKQILWDEIHSPDFWHPRSDQSLVVTPTKNVEQFQDVNEMINFPPQTLDSNYFPSMLVLLYDYMYIPILFICLYIYI